MPATFPSHPGIVLPLKVWRPRWFDGVALVVGAGAPDLTYSLDGTRLQRPVASWPATWAVAHSWPGVVVWGLPVTLACAWVIRLAAPTVAAHLPTRPSWLALRDYAALAISRPAWPITVWSALLGSASHVLWDRLADKGPVDLASSVVGGLLTVAMFIHIGRNRLVRAWHGPGPTVTPNPTRFWGTAVGAVLAGAAVLPLLPGARLPHTTGVRVLGLIPLALLVAAATHHVARQPSTRTHP